jgi:L-iditol 2-dehydrogenase
MGSSAPITINGNGQLKASSPNISLQVTADHQIKMEEAPVHEPGPGEVLLHVKATGICG